MDNSKSAVSEAYRGACIVVPDGLQKSGFESEFNQLVFQAFSETAGYEKAEEVKVAGPQRMHELMPVADLIRTNQRLNRLLNAHTLRFTKGIVSKSLEHTRSIYISTQAIARFMVPVPFLEDHQRSAVHRRNPYECCGRVEQGRVTPLHLHRDSWYGLPQNTLNLWLAMSEILQGNGMLFYLSAFGKKINHTGVVIDPNFSPGESIHFKVNKGDILLFNGEHLHATEPNHTNGTRFVISFRFCFKRPSFKPSLRPSVYFHDSRFISTPLEKIFCIPTQTSFFKGLPANCLSRIFNRPTEKKIMNPKM